jgi:hypothetical protein
MSAVDAAHGQPVADVTVQLLDLLGPNKLVARAGTSKRPSGELRERHCRAGHFAKRVGEARPGDAVPDSAGRTRL